MAEILEDRLDRLDALDALADFRENGGVDLDGLKADLGLLLHTPGRTFQRGGERPLGLGPHPRGPIRPSAMIHAALGVVVPRMAVDRKLLEILCCPVTRVPVERLSAAKLQRVNEAIREGRVKQADGSPVETELCEALVTSTGTTIYPVEDGIPLMLEDRSIASFQIESLG